MRARTMRTLASAAAITAVLFAVTACASGTGSSSAGSGSSTLDKIKKAGVVTVATTGTGAPDSFTVDGHPGDFTGTMPTLMKAMAKDWGVKIKWQTSNFSGLISAVQSGRAQIMADGMFITPERSTQVTFSQPLYGWSEAIAVRSSDKGSYPGLTSLQGKTVGVITSTVEADELAKLGGVTVHSYDNYQLLVQDLSVGRIQAALVDPPSISFLVKKDPSLKVKVLDQYHGSNPFFIGFASAKNDPGLAKAINQELDHLRKTGELKKIITRFEGKVGILLGKPGSASPSPTE